MFVETQIGDTTVEMSESTFRGGLFGQCLMLGAVGWLSTLALVSLDFHLVDCVTSCLIKAVALTVAFVGGGGCPSDQAVTMESLLRSSHASVETWFEASCCFQGVGLPLLKTIVWVSHVCHSLRDRQ